MRGRYDIGQGGKTKDPEYGCNRWGGGVDDKVQQKRQSLGL